MNIDASVSLTDLITAIAAAGGLIVAILGLSTWRKQLHGTYEYDLARRLMLEVYQLRDALRSTRNPFLSASEADEDDTEDTWEVSTYSKRWESVREVINQFKITSLEAEVVWDDATKQLNKNMDRLIRELYGALNAFARMKKNKSFAEDFYKNYDDIIYDKGDSDRYNTSLNEVVKGYENALKPHLKK